MSVPFTVAVFASSLSSTPSAKLSTVTSKLTTVCAGALSVPAGTSTSIPFAKSSSVTPVLASSFTFILSGTKLVPSGIVSFISAFPAKYPLFVTVIVYVIFSPSTT